MVIINRMKEWRKATNPNNSESKKTLIVSKGDKQGLQLLFKLVVIDF